MSFGTTHVISGHGAATWATPDVSTAPGPRLDPKLPVEIIAVWGDWARVRCENGWEAWTDGRTLTAVPAQSVVARTPLYPVLAPIGGASAGAAAWLPWLSADGFQVNGWDFSLWGLITDEATTSGVKAGLIVTLGGLAIAAAFVRLPAWSLLLFALLAAIPSALLIMRWLTAEGERATLGLGAPTGVVAGVLIGYAAWDAHNSHGRPWTRAAPVSPRRRMS